MSTCTEQAAQDRLGKVPFSIANDFWAQKGTDYN